MGSTGPVNYCGVTVVMSVFNSDLRFYEKQREKKLLNHRIVSRPIFQVVVHASYRSRKQIKKISWVNDIGVEAIF